jgi:hypothetical protein
MTAVTFEASLFEHLSTLFIGSSSVRDFRHRFSRSSWESGEELSDELYELASDIEHLGYIRDSGVWDDAVYLQNLKQEVVGFCASPPGQNTAANGKTHANEQCRRAQVA